jgi:hypothetical protein
MNKKTVSETIRTLLLIGMLMLPTLLIISTSTLAFHDQGIYAPLNLSSKVQDGNLDFLEEQVVGLVNGSRVYNYDLELEKIAFRHHAFRAGGSTGANEAANWIKGQFESLGLEAWLEPFQFTNWTLLSKPSLMVDDDGNQGTTSDQVMIHSFQSTHFSWPTPEKGVFADLVILPLPAATSRSEIGINSINMAEWNAIDTSGKVVLVGREVRWSHYWEQIYKTKLSEQPPAAIVYTWWYNWMSFTPPTLSSAGGRPLSSLGSYYWDLNIPVGFVNYEDGLWIRNMENTNVSAHFSIESVIGLGPHYNVVGKINGYKYPEKFIIISSHYDTVMCGGFCDNGAGTAGVIEFAKVFAEAVEKGFYRPSYTLLFIAFASEELGLVGSINYIKQHKIEMPNIIAVVNLDCIGSDDFYVTKTDPANGFDLDEIVFDAAQDLGITAVLEEPGGSDQESFRRPLWANYYYWSWGLEANISDATPIEPSVMLFSHPLLYSDEWSMGTPGWIHTSYDNSTSTETLNWIEVKDLENHIKVAALTIMRISPSTPARVSPYIEILSPKDKTYTTGSVSLSFAVDEATSWIGYSLDGQMNVTIAGNTTLSGLSVGSHNLIVYARDTSGNLAASEIIYFTVEIQQAQPFPIWIITVIVIVVVVGTTFVVYFTKAKKKAEKIAQQSFQSMCMPTVYDFSLLQTY